MDIKYCSYCQRLWKEEDCITGQTYIGEAWGVPQYESWYTCPYCNSTDIEEAEDEEEEDE